MVKPKRPINDCGTLSIRTDIRYRILESGRLKFDKKYPSFIFNKARVQIYSALFADLLARVEDAEDLQLINFYKYIRFFKNVQYVIRNKIKLVETPIVFGHDMYTVNTVDTLQNMLGYYVGELYLDGTEGILYVYISKEMERGR